MPETYGTIGADPFMPELPPDPPRPRTLTDREALDRLNYMLSAPEWSVSFLEDACEIVRATGRVEIADAEWEAH